MILGGATGAKLGGPRVHYAKKIENYHPFRANLLPRRFAFVFGAQDFNEFLLII